MFVNSDFSDLLRIFNDHNVRYMVIGGYAVVQYAEPRFTKDLDMLISTDTANAEAVYDALLVRGHDEYRLATSLLSMYLSRKLAGLSSRQI